ncbi:MAG: hypothetical protein V1859_01670 [archaeon]
MWPFKPKFARIEDQQEKKEDESAVAAPSNDDFQGKSSDSMLGAEIMKLKAQFDQFSELRKVFNERFTRINEQIGELRGMIMDTNRSMQDVEVKTVKAVDLVSAVQPDKLMVEVKKQDAKIEALKANIESNEAIMKSILDQLKDMRIQVSKFRGVDQIVSLSEDVKKELMNIKKVEATLERHSDKVEGIFMESQKRFQDFERVVNKQADFDKQVKAIQEQSDQLKIKIPVFSTKKEMEDLQGKYNEFEKHTANVIDLVTKRANDLPVEINDRFARFEKNINSAFEKKIRKTDETNKLISEIEKKAQKIAKELKLHQATTEKKEEGASLINSDMPKAENKDEAPSKEATEKKARFLEGLFKKKEKEKK